MSPHVSPDKDQRAVLYFTLAYLFQLVFCVIVSSPPTLDAVVNTLLQYYFYFRAHLYPYVCTEA